MGARSGALNSALSILALAHVCRAQPAETEARRPSVRVSATCTIEGTSVAGMLDILRAEVAPASVSELSGAPALDGEGDVAVIIDSCGASVPTARIVVYRGAERREKWIDLIDVESTGRERALALALAETVERITWVAPTVASSAQPNTVQQQPAAPDAKPLSEQPEQTPASDEPVERSAPPLDDRAPDAVAPGSPRRPFVRLGPLLRYMQRTKTPFFGVDAGLTWNRLGFGLRGLAASDDTSLGSTLHTAVAGVVAAEWLALGRFATIRSDFELGAAIADGSPRDTAVGHTKASPHWAFTTSLQLLSPMTEQWVLEGAVGGGYGESLTIRVDGRDVSTLSGWYLNVFVGARWSPARSTSNESAARAAGPHTGAIADGVTPAMARRD